MIIRETDDLDGLKEMFIRYKLEYSFEEPLPTDILKAWEAVDENGRRIGGSILALRGTEYVLDGIATEEEARGTGAGGKLLQVLMDEVVSRGGKSLFLAAKVPDFYYHYGFEAITAEEAPGLFDCPQCPQYQKSCYPEIMRKTL